MTGFLIYNVVMSVLCFIIILVACLKEADVTGWVLFVCLMFSITPIVREFLIMLLIVMSVVSLLDRKGYMEQVYFNKRSL